MEQPGVFDIVGPIMVGPSSSHTAGAVRLGRAARFILGEPAGRAVITLHGSFAATGLGHGTNLALIAGLLGMQTDDDRIRRAGELANEAGLDVTFKQEDLGDVHPNSVLIDVESAGRRVCILGASIGGGRVLIKRIDDFEVSLSGRYYTLITRHKDAPGMVAHITRILADFGINIAFLEVSRRSRGRLAMLIAQTDEQIPHQVSDEILTVPGVERVRILPPF